MIIRNHSNRILSVLAATSMLAFTATTALADAQLVVDQIFKIDIDSTTQGQGLPVQTATGWTSLDATEPSNGDGVIVDGINFSIGSADGSRLRVAAGNPNPNPLTADFVFDDGPNEAVILFFGGAGDLSSGLWEADVYINDTPAQPDNLIVGYRTNNAETIVSNSVSPNPISPAISFQFQSDGVSAYDVFVREGGNDRSRLNAVELRSLAVVPEPATFSLLALGLLGFIRVASRRRRR